MRLTAALAAQWPAWPPAAAAGRSAAGAPAAQHTHAPAASQAAPAQLGQWGGPVQLPAQLPPQLSAQLLAQLPAQARLPAGVQKLLLCMHPPRQQPSDVLSHVGWHSLLVQAALPPPQ